MLAARLSFWQSHAAAIVLIKGESGQMLSKTGARWTGRAGRTMVAWFPCRAGGGRGGHSSWATQPAACARTVPKTSSENKTEVGEQARRASRG